MKILSISAVLILATAAAVAPSLPGCSILEPDPVEDVVVDEDIMPVLELVADRTSQLAFLAGRSQEAVDAIFQARASLELDMPLASVQASVGALSALHDELLYQTADGALEGHPALESLWLAETRSLRFSVGLEPSNSPGPEEGS